MTYRDGEIEVPKFAAAMQAQMDANAHKGGWHDDDTEELYERLVEESEELRNELYPTFGTVPWAVIGDEHKARILKEAADVANFALMLADRCGALERSGS